MNIDDNWYLSHGELYDLLHKGYRQCERVTEYYYPLIIVNDTLDADELAAICQTSRDKVFIEKKHVIDLIRHGQTIIEHECDTVLIKASDD